MRFSEGFDTIEPDKELYPLDEAITAKLSTIHLSQCFDGQDKLLTKRQSDTFDEITEEVGKMEIQETS